jgi:type II secretory pathway component PulF
MMSTPTQNINSSSSASKPRQGFAMYWDFTAQASNAGGKRKIQGMVQARSEGYALGRVKRMGFKRPQVRVNAMQTLSSGFGWIVHSDFDLRDKARLYETLGKRLQRDGSLLAALDSAQEYLQDGRLKGAVAILAAQANDGQPPHAAMQTAGFSLRDSMVVRALSESGNAHQAFTDLAAEARTRYQRDTALSSALRMPILMMLVLYLALPAFFLGLGPKIIKFFKRLGTQNTNIPDSIKIIYGLVDWVNANVQIAALIYIAMGLGAIALWKSSIWSALALKIKAFRDLSLKSEHASIWSVYGLMYAAGIPGQDICTVLKPATQLRSTSEALARMSKRLAAGSDDRDAVQSAGFPKFVVAGYRAARDSGSLSDGLKSFSAMLNEDIELLTAQTKAWLQLMSLVIMAFAVLGIFYVVYYPIAGPVLNSL